MPEKSITIADVVNIIASQAPRGMGSQTSIIVDHLFDAYYRQGRVNRPHRSTISRNRRKITMYGSGLIYYYRGRPAVLQESIYAMLRLYPGLAAIYTVNNRIGCLVEDSKLPDTIKQTLQAEYHPDSTDVCVISTYVARVMHCVICNV